MDTFSILVIEDSSSDADLLYQNFVRAGKKDWSFTRVECLNEGIAKAKTNHFDIALLDLSLPDSDGLDTVENFMAAVPNVPAIVLTIASNEKLALAAIGKGAQDYLIKGEITPNLLVRAIYYSIERGQLLRQLIQSNADLKTFSLSMAHDMQAPLRTIRILSEIVLKDYGDQLDDTAQDYLKRSIATTNRLKALIGDLLAYSHVGQSDLQLQEVDLTEVVTEVVRDLEPLIAETHAEVILQQSSFTVKAHRSIVVQAVLNLITNAIKFVAPDTQPKIQIWAESRDRWIRLWIEDNGIGISPENRQKIFEVFIRLHGINSYPGMGVGLALVKRGIERLNGRVGVESQHNRGSKFWLELPAFSEETATR